MQTATDGSIESWPARKVEIQVCLAQMLWFVLVNILGPKVGFVWVKKAGL